MATGGLLHLFLFVVLFFKLAGMAFLNSNTHFFDMWIGGKNYYVTIKCDHRHLK